LVACEGNREDKGKTLAKINGTSYTQGDFEFMLKTQTPDRQEEMLKDPEARRKQFNFMLKQKLQAMASQKSRYGKDPVINKRQSAADSLVLSSAPLDSFFKASAKHYEEKARCDIYYIKTSGKKAADEAYKAVSGGMSFADAVDKYTINAESKPNHGKVGRLVQ